VVDEPLLQHATSTSNLGDAVQVSVQNGAHEIGCHPVGLDDTVRHQAVEEGGEAFGLDRDVHVLGEAAQFPRSRQDLADDLPRALVHLPDVGPQRGRRTGLGGEGQPDGALGVPRLVEGEEFAEQFGGERAALLADGFRDGPFRLREDASADAVDQCAQREELFVK
jgi:hypothetical protein